MTINNMLSSNSTLGSVTVPSGFTLDKPWMEIPAGATVSGAGNVETTGVITGAGILATTGTVVSTAKAPTQPKFDRIEEATATKGVALKGRSDGGTPATGDIGEYRSSVLTSSTPVSLAIQGTDYAVTTIVNPGNGLWMVCGTVHYTGTATAITYATANISTNGTINQHPEISQFSIQGSFNVAAVADVAITLPTWVLNISGPTTISLVTRAGFSSGTVQAYGSLYAIRIA
jgi:hypothetical protein